MNKRKIHLLSTKRVIAPILIIIISFLTFGVFAQGYSVENHKKELDKAINQVNKLFSEGEYEEVLDIIDDAIKLDPINPSLFYVKGVAEENIGKNDAAIDSYTKAILHDENYHNAIYNLGLQLLKRAINSSNSVDTLTSEMHKDFIYSLNHFEKFHELKPEINEVNSMITYIKEELKRPYKIDDEIIYGDENNILAEQLPMFIGGDAKMYQYINEHIIYPIKAKEQLISGRVFITFVVEKDGSLTNVKILKGIGGGCGEEAVRVIESMPKWIPGKLNGIPVRVQYRMPLKFFLGESKK